jgi:small subunit ribosomal protein S6
MMRTYELLMLAVPEITEDESKALEKHVEEQVKQGQGSMVLFDRWGKYRLAYPVNKNEYGVYFLARFQAPAETNLLDELKRSFVVRMHTTVMRHMVSVLEGTVSAVYQRPLSLEETPAREVGSFMREGREGREGRGGGYFPDRRHNRTLPEENVSVVSKMDDDDEDDDSAE